MILPTPSEAGAAPTPRPGAASAPALDTVLDAAAATADAPRRSAGSTARTFYREYLLSCQPFRLDNGRFQPRVVITSMAGDKTRSQRFLDLDESSATEAEAVDRARRAGMDWVDVNDRAW